MWMRGAGHWVATDSASPQASLASHRGCSPLHQTQSYWGVAVWQRLQSPCPTEQSYSTTGVTEMMLGVSPEKPCHPAPQQPQGLTVKSIGTVHAQMARPAQVNPHLELWLYSLITELEMGNGERGEIQDGVGGRCGYWGIGLRRSGQRKHPNA